MTYIHLRVHTAYSLLEGAIKTSRLAPLCLEHKMPAIGITDTNNLFGALEISLNCKSKGIQPIIGCQIGLDFDSQFDIKSTQTQKPIVLLAQSQQGYANLLKLMSQVHLHQNRDKHGQSISIKTLSEYNQGLICLTGAYKGPFGHLLNCGQKDQAYDLLKSFQNIFNDRLYMEIMRHNTKDAYETQDAFINMAYDVHIPLVATNDVFYETPNMHEAHDALMCIAQGTYVGEVNRTRLSPDHYFKSPDEMKALFQDLPEAIHNTVEIAQRCYYAPHSIKPILPKFSTQSNRNEVEELRIQAKTGLDNRLNNLVFKDSLTQDEKENLKQIYHDRLDHELKIIEQMGFPGYFLIVADFIQWAKSVKIPVGPGRGSGAGSLTAWSLTITDIDPIRFDLLFERFLNPERVSMPDFDIDFCQDRRDEVIDYVRRKYGDSCVAHIITFGKLQARAVLRDVGRVLQMPYGQVDKICKLIPNNPANPTTLEQAIEIEPQLKEALEVDETVQKLISIGIQLEGLYRHASTHAAGVVIGDRPLDELVPLYKDDRSILPATQFSMKYVEEAGLVKFDFLGLKTLTVIQECCALLAKKGIEIDINKIPLDDSKTFQLLTNVESVGIFQLESAGMRDVLRKLKPDRFEDLIALVALYRPGPMDDIPRYIACKQGTEEVSYLHPDLMPILNTTYGVMVYQEQVMQIAQKIGGYSLGAADLLRRAMGKKIKSEMDAQQAKFLKGALEHGLDEQVAVKIFDQMAKFAGYGFNKSHSAPYALLTYQTAYLKVNHRHEFFAASMTHDLHNIDKLNVFREDVDNSGIPLLPPDINTSDVIFSVEELTKNWTSDKYQDVQKHNYKGIRYGLAAIKNVGAQAMQQVVDERTRNGPFTSVQDFASRIDPRVINKRQLEKLICAGVFDQLNPNRKQLFLSVELLLRHAATHHQSRKSLQQDLFTTSKGIIDTQPIALHATNDWDAVERLNFEFDALGFYLSSHPLSIYQKSLEKMCISSSDKLSTFCDGDNISLAGVLLAKQERMSKNGQKYAFLQLSDTKGQFEVTLFSKTLGEARDSLVIGSPLVIRAGVRRNNEDNTIRLIGNSFENLDNLLQNQILTAEIKMSPDTDVEQFIEKLSKNTPGNTKIFIKIDFGKEGVVVIKPNDKYHLAPNIQSQILSISGIHSINIV